MVGSNMYAMSLGFEIATQKKNLYYTCNMCAYIDPLCISKGSCKGKSQGINHELRMSRKAKYTNESSRLHLSLVSFYSIRLYLLRYQKDNLTILIRRYNVRR